jgi:hypothetical protein
MQPTHRTARLALAIALPAAGVLGTVGLASALGGHADPTPSTVRFARSATSSSPASPQQVDISGPCDELEHVDDPRCAGVVTPSPTVTPTTPTTAPDDDDDDISGPCDEAEHANDPRCMGGAPADSSGPGPGGDEDHSGPGHGGDDEDNSNSGPGSGGDDDDNSNSGPGDGDDGDDD